MKLVLRKIITVLICLIIAQSFSACSSSGEPLEITDGFCTVPNEYVSFTVPEASFVFSAASYAFSDDWTLAGIADPVNLIKDYEEMGTLAHVVSLGGKNNVYVTKKESELTAEIYNLTEAGAESLKLVQDDLAGMNETEGFEVTVGDAVINDIQFATAEIRYTPKDTLTGEFMHEYCYVTIINGISYSFDAYVKGADLSEEQLDYLHRFMDGVVLEAVAPQEAGVLTPAELAMALIPFALIILLIVFLIVFSSMRKKKALREKNDLAERLSEYRNKQKREAEENPNRAEPKTLFVNKTVHTDSAIQQFSYFHSYKKHLFVIPAYLITGVLAIILGFSFIASGTEDLLWALLFIAAGIYCIVKLFTTPNSVYKTLLRVYNKLPNRVALYMFREDDFRLSGLQATGVFPYFQLSGVYETKDKFYLYFGEDNAYYMDKNNFSYGEVNEFREFIKEKVGKKYQRRMF